MQKNHAIRFVSTRRMKFLTLTLILLGMILPSVAPATATDELFADGNRLFRDDLYWAALLRYRQANEAGLETPLLHYNMGVAHYKAGQYLRARESLKKASRSHNLEVISHYNLGLNAWALDKPREALRWFRRAANQERSAKISKLARKAIARIEAGEKRKSQEDLIVILAEEKRQEKEVYNFRFYARVGGGVDSNVFRSPSAPYVDLADPNQPLVVPVIQQGFFIPVSLQAKYLVNSFEHESFFGSYRFRGRFYQDKALTNGDEYLHELSFGSEYLRREESRTRRIFSAFTVAKHEEVYFDRNDGIGRIVNDIDIADRLNYTRYGPEFSFRQSHDRFTIAARGVAQLWSYEDTVEVPAYDHEYFLVGLSAQYRFTRTSLLRITGDTFKRFFSDRPSFELDGTQPLGNLAVRYDYVRAGITARQRVTRSIWFGLDYKRTDREDRYRGYNNYIKNSYGAELHWKIGNRFDLEASAAFQVYDYENAFAFQNPAAGPKTLERTLGRVNATFDMTRTLTLVMEYRYEDIQSNDTRIAYDRSRFGLNLRWQNH